MPGPSDYGPGPGHRYRPARQTEHHQIHPIDQDGGDLDRISTRIWDHCEPTQVGAHLGGGQQPEGRQADNRHMAAAGGHRSSHTHRQRPGSGEHRHSAPGQPAGKDSGQRFRDRQQRFRTR